MSRSSFWHTVGLHRIPGMIHAKESIQHPSFPNTVLVTSQTNNHEEGAKPWQPWAHLHT